MYAVLAGLLSIAIAKTKLHAQPGRGREIEVDEIVVFGAALLGTAIVAVAVGAVGTVAYVVHGIRRRRGGEAAYGVVEEPDA